MSYRSRVFFVLGALMALAVSVTLRASSTVDAALLKTIASRVSGTTGIMTIESSDPVPYVASQPDPKTFVVELRDVVSRGYADHFKADSRSPLSAVQVESARAADGADVTRVKVSLTQPMRPRVRSSRNVIYIEADRLDVPPTGASVAATPAPVAQAPLNVQDPINALTLPEPQPAQLAQQPDIARARGQLAAPPVAVTQAAQAPQPGAPQAPTPAPATAPPSRYTGTPVSLDFQSADLRAVLRTFADISGLNIVIDPAVQGTVDVALRDVPWDQALEIILRANKLGYSIDGNIMRVAALSVLADEQAQRQKLVEQAALAGELKVRTIPLSYARAEDIRPLLTSTALSARGTIQTDARTNTLIISDLEERLDRAAALIATLDSPQPQVEIEARIVQTTRDFSRTLGVQWGFNGVASPALGNTTPLPFPNSGSVSGGVNLGAAPQSTLKLALGSVNGAINLDVALSALEKQGHGRILSTPRVSTQNNVEAEITQGTQIPIQTVANNTVTVTFKDAALTLKVTPQITAADTVIMRISLENSAADFSRAVGASQIPPIDTQRAITQVLVSNGDTTVIGGIYVSQQQTSQDRTPGLYRLPLLGWLFRRDGIQDQNRELLIFITPKIIRL
jgi:type IV pilus secretin PilQ/predicted competence protein